jgi:hypothetical protein
LNKLAIETCDSCHTILEMPLTMKPRDHEAPIRVAIRWFGVLMVQWSRKAAHPGAGAILFTVMEHR